MPCFFWHTYKLAFSIVVIFVGVILGATSVNEFELQRLLTDEYPYSEIENGCVVNDTSVSKVETLNDDQTTDITYYVDIYFSWVYKNQTFSEWVRYDRGYSLKIDAEEKETYFREQKVVPCYYTELSADVGKKYDGAFTPLRLTPYTGSYGDIAFNKLIVGVCFIGAAIIAFLISFPILLWQASKIGDPVPGCNCHRRRQREQAQAQEMTLA